jgi:hypothetical protein
MHAPPRNGKRKAAVLAALYAFTFLIAAAAAELDAKQKAEYRELRKQFFLTLPLPAKKGTKNRKEVRRYIARLTRFIKATTPTAPKYAAAARYYRGRMNIKLRRFKKARADFDGCLQTLTAPQTGENRRPRGLPSECAIRIFRAFTFLEDGNDKIADELEAIPESAGKPRYHEVGSLVLNWADALADAEQLELALRAYRIVKRFDLWEEEADDPQRKITLIEVRLGKVPALGAAPGENAKQTENDTPATADRATDGL